MITSAGNTFVKNLTALGQKKRRDETGLFILEGESFVKAIPPMWEIKHLVLAERYAKACAELAPNTIIIADSLFKKISDAVTPQGVLAVCVQKQATLEDCLGGGFLLFAENLADPGNVGAIIRTAAAAGCGGVILSQGSADAYSPKVLRASAGAFFRVPVVEGTDTASVLRVIGQKGYMRVAAHPRGIEDSLYTLDFKQKCCILIGNESAGLSETALSLCDKTVKIPMAAGVESLNAAVSAGILMYEIVRACLKNPI